MERSCARGRSTVVFSLVADAQNLLDILPGRLSLAIVHVPFVFQFGSEPLFSTPFGRIPDSTTAHFARMAGTSRRPGRQSQK
jgi:hypothetical protein